MPEEAALIRESVRGLVAEQSEASLVRRLEDDDWSEIARDDLGAWTILAEEAARALHPAPVLDYFVSATLGLDATTAVVYPTGDERVGYVHGDAWPDASGFAVLEDDGVSLYETMEVEAVEGIDASARLGRVTALPGLATKHRDEAARIASGVLILQAAMSNALSRRMLDLAVDHALTREQFGRPIGTFQAVKHQLADALVALTASESAVRFAIEEPDQRAASTVARILSGRGASEVGRVCQQVLGAMGFTWEFPLHHYLRRAYAVDLLNGPWERHARGLGIEAIGGAPVPRLGSV